jgi:hypothetical protein
MNVCNLATQQRSQQDGLLTLLFIHTYRRLGKRHFRPRRPDEYPPLA